MNDDGAAGALARALTFALVDLAEISGVSDGAPQSQADAHASLDIGPETDWGHKSGAGAEIRFAVLLRSGGEGPNRVRRLLQAARARIDQVSPQMDGWRLVSLAFLRARTLREPGPRWTAVIEYRARLLAS